MTDQTPKPVNVTERIGKDGKVLTGAAALGAGPGRPKGIPNKSTIEFRETVSRLLRDNNENIGRWLTLVAEGDGSDKSKPNPARALELLAQLAEFAAPKLGRVEHVGENGGAIEIKTVPDEHLAARIKALQAKLDGGN